jgi:hypothetical protein
VWPRDFVEVVSVIFRLHCVRIKERTGVEMREVGWKKLLGEGDVQENRDGSRELGRRGDDISDKGYRSRRTIV